MNHAPLHHPRPDWRRSSWTSLDGTWDVAFRDDRTFAAVGFDRRIEVPFAYQWPRSGLGDATRHDVVWYRRTFDDVRESAAERLLLHFGAVDYCASVWVNGSHIGDHDGGHTPFSFDISEAVSASDNVLLVRAEDPLEDLHLPRGKQFWAVEDAWVFYRPTTGIWQSVWLEPVPGARITDATFRPDLDTGLVEVSLLLTTEAIGSRVRLKCSFDDAAVVDDTFSVFDASVVRTISLLEPAHRVGTHVADHQGVHVWSPESPALYDVELELLAGDGAVVDRVRSYFGVRKIQARDGRIWLNGRPYPLRLVLDQGYYEDGGLTGTAEEFRRDIALVKEMGFNGVRKHQKIADPRWLYLADTMGLLVWAEMPSAYRYSDHMAARLVREWTDVVRRDRNHPCITTWVPMNESWGVPKVTVDASQRALVEALTQLTRSIDPTRLVVSNDGWEQTTADLFTVHDYRSPQELCDSYGDADIAISGAPGGHVLSVEGHPYDGQPIVLSEFGGVSLSDDEAAWGYSAARDADDLACRVEAFLTAAGSAAVLAGYCYTQLTDIGSEANGLLTFDREPKVPLERIRRAVLGRGSADDVNPDTGGADLGHDVGVGGSGGH